MQLSHIVSYKTGEGAQSLEDAIKAAIATLTVAPPLLMSVESFQIVVSYKDRDADKDLRTDPATL